MLCGLTKKNLGNSLGHFWIINVIFSFRIDHYFLQAQCFHLLCSPQTAYVNEGFPVCRWMKLRLRDDIHLLESQGKAENQIGFVSFLYSKLSFIRYIHP